MLRKLGVLAVALFVLSLGAPAQAVDPLQRALRQVTDNAGATCTRLGWMPKEVCTALRGFEVSEDRMRAYEASWIHRALGLQRALDDGAPFLRQLLPHTHNSSNAFSYPPTVTQLDSNQIHSVRDQLRMDIRAIEFDLHNHPNLDNPLADPNEVVLCHGEVVPLGAVAAHVGCSLDRSFTSGLAELRGWLTAPGNTNEVVLLYLENNLDDAPAAHARAAADIQKVLGDLVYTPADHAAGPCAPMPMATSRAAIRAAGRRVLVVGNCGPGAWGTWVHERGPQWDESSSPDGDDYPAFTGCAAERARVGYATHLVRRYEDSTGLSRAAGRGGELTATEARRMVQCGVNLVGFDQLHPDDPRLAQLVWSWAPNEPAAGGGACAAHGADARFRAVSCANALSLACVSATGAWSVAATSCPAGTRFGAPANGYDNELLRAAKAAAGVANVRLAYANVNGLGWLPQ